jgi:virginiamycin B lyase
MSRRSTAFLLVAALCSLAPLAAQAQQKTSALPDGPDKALVEGVCSVCHPVSQIVQSSGYTHEGWKELIGTMINLAPMPEQQEKITKYLVANFPPNSKRAPTLVKGDAKIAFKEWTVPTLGQRSRDPVEAPDGSIWWVGQWADLIGRINPKTGSMKEYPLPSKSKPHTVTIDKAGGVWYTGNGNGTIGKIDPATGKVTVYKMPDPKAKDPHSAKFDPKGILWFTLQNSNMLGRLDPATGDIKLATMKTPNSKPYGIKIDAQGNPWVACNGSNCLVKINPANFELTEIKLPTPGTTVRRLDIAPDGLIWYVNSGKGKLGRLDPKTGDIKEWNSPSGPGSHPYAIAVVGGYVWYNESGQRPDVLVRFDPKTEKFQSWPIPSGNVHAGIIRHMRPTRDGNLLIHQSSTNRIILVTLNAGR